MIENQVHMPSYIRAQCDLANTYAEQGEYGQAAKILYAIAITTQIHYESICNEKGVTASPL